MSYIDTLFPEAYGNGTSCTLGFRSTCHDTHGGDDIVISENQLARRNWTIQARTLTADKATEILDFYYAVDGPVNTFRFRDPFDWSTTPNHRSLPGAESDGSNFLAATFNSRALHPFAFPNGTDDEFQIIKWYYDGDNWRTRPIDKLPASGDPYFSRTFWARGVPVGNYTQLTSGFTLDRSTGVFTSTVAPLARGTQICWSGTFHNHVRFDPTISESMLVENVRSAATSEGRVGGVHDVRLIEVPSLIEDGEPKQPGGATRRVIDIDTQLQWGDGVFQEISCTASGKIVFLPDQAYAITGGPALWLRNDGPNAFEVQGVGGTTIVASLAVNQVVMLVLNSGSAWIAI